MRVSDKMSPVSVEYRASWWSERHWQRCCRDRVRIGEDRTERLDFIPARYQVMGGTGALIPFHPRRGRPKLGAFHPSDWHR